MKRTLKIILIVLAVAAVVCIKAGIISGGAWLGLLSIACAVLASGLILSFFTKGTFTACLTGLCLGYIIALVMMHAFNLHLLYEALAALAGGLIAFAVEKIR